MGTGRRSARSSARPGSPRALALGVLRRVVEQGAYSNLALAAELGRSKLGDQDRRLATDLVYGTLRKLLVLDHAIGGAARRPVTDIDPEALALLRMGAYQVLFTRIPPHAAVSETVDLAGPRHRGFVNAVLRALSAGSPPMPHGSGDDSVSARTGLAPWAVAELRRLLPDGEVEAAAAALASPAGLSLRTNPCAALQRDPLIEALREAGHEARPGAHHPDVVWLAPASPATLPGFREGWFAVQDEASALVASALEPASGERILDACSAPGGKAADLACRVTAGGTVVAADLLPKRLALVRRTARRLGVRVLLVAQDARRPALRGPFEAALIDAPCSGLGAARRRPELLWRPRRADLAHLARLQVAILAGTADLVAPGGRLVYSVCTFPRAETDAVVRAFLSKRRDVEPTDIPGPDGRAFAHRLWPHRHGTDAMFFCGFRRRAEPV